MPNRIVKETICTSETIAKLTWFEEVFFYRLIVNCDDYGRFDARPAILKARLFPLKDRITLKYVGDALNKLTEIGCVCLYEYDGKPYLYLTAWNAHQRIRDSKEKYPSPENDGSRRVAASCGELPRVAAVIQSQSESISESESNARAFDAFWSAYPRKVGKDAARRAFAKRRPSAELVQKMITAVEAQKQSAQWQKDGGQYIPNPATWLNQGRWDDEPVRGKATFANHDGQRRYSDSQLAHIGVDLGDCNGL